MVSDEVSNFKREISIDSDATFLDLRNAICDSVGYDKNQMSSFFLCTPDWEKEREITLEDMGYDSATDAYIMEECPLRDFVEDEGQRLIFVFDYITDRAFFIELKKIEPTKHLSEPICTLAMGNPPAQFVDLDEFDERVEKAKATTTDDDYDFNDDSYDNGYNDEDIANLSDDISY